MADNLLNMGKGLTIEERIIIEYLLSENFTLKAISNRVGKYPTTISKKIKRNRYSKPSKVRQNDLLRCENLKACTKKNICNDNCSLLCKKCNTLNCYRICQDYSIKKCTKLSRYPYVCNGCSSSIGCIYEKNIIRLKLQILNMRSY